MTFGARALIRLGALKQNLEVIRAAAPGAKVMAVIKANAYGHGLVAVAKTLRDVDAFAVARLPEAIRLRDAGITCPIVLLSGVLTGDELSAALCRGCHVVVHCPEQIELLENTSAEGATVWLKIDTGMNRLGFRPEDAAGAMQRLRACRVVGDLRLMTHFACADELEDPATEAQLRTFQPIVEGFCGAVSVANTSAMFGWPKIAAAGKTLDFSGEHWIRPGVALFGISPFAGRTGADFGLTPVMRFEAQLIAVKPLAEGARVGYKGRYQSQRDTLLGVVSAGYGDGYKRHFRSGTPVLINDRRVPVIGNVSMDLLTVDLGPGATDSVGDIATLWGDGLPVEEVAPWADAIPYDLVCGVMHREASEIID